MKILKPSTRTIQTRGRLYFAAISSVVISVQCCYASVNTKINYNLRIAKQGWQAYASVRVKNVTGNNENDSAGNEWFKRKEYAESIYKVMAQAIADCQNVQAEFLEAATARSNAQSTTTIVEFSNTIPAKYDGSNWNAVILWNYLAEAIHNFYQTGTEGDACVEKIGQIVKFHYQSVQKVKIDDLEEKIKKAVDDIKEYAKVLDLYDYIFVIKASRSSEIKLKHAPEVTCQHEFNCEQSSGEYCIGKARVTINRNNIDTPINVKMYNGEVIEYLTTQGRFRQLDDEMNLTQPLKSSQELDNLESELLAPDQVRTLTNYGNVPGEVYGERIENLTSAKCYFNAAMGALHASPTFRKTVKMLSELPTLESYSTDPNKKLIWSIAPIVQRFFDAIEDGTMDRNNGWQCDNNYTKALQDLIYRLDDNEANKVYDMYKYDIDYTNENLGFLHEYVKRLIDADKLIQEKRNEDTLKKYLPNGAAADTMMDRIIKAIDCELEYRGMPTICNRIETDIADRLYDDKHHRKPSYLSEIHAAVVRMETNHKSLDECLKFHQQPSLPYTMYIPEKGEVPVVTPERMLVLPQMLIFVAPQSYDQKTKRNKIEHVLVPDTIYAKDSLGMHKYRVVSSVDAWGSYGGHYFAEVKTKDGWVYENDYGEGTKPRKHHTEKADDDHVRAVMIYEKCK